MKLKLIYYSIIYWKFKIFKNGPLYFLINELYRYDQFIKNKMKPGDIVKCSMNIISSGEYKLYFETGNEKNPPRLYFDIYPEPIGKCYNAHKILVDEFECNYEIISS